MIEENETFGKTWPFKANLRGSIMKRSFLLIILCILWVLPLHSASVSCNFFSETVISKNGEWLKTESDFMKLYEIFGDGLELKLDNSLLASLDSGLPFLAGNVSRGRVFLLGNDIGVEGKLIATDDEKITIYDGLCTIGFG